MINKILCALLCTACSFSILAQENEPAISRSLMKFSPQHFVQDALKIGIEKFNSSFTHSHSIYLMGVVGNHSSNYGKHGYDGMGLEAQYRKYLSPMKVYTGKKGNEFYRGVFLGGFLQGGYYTGDQVSRSLTYDPSNGNYAWQTHNDYTATIINYGTGFTIGFEWIFAEVISFETFIGGGFQFSNRSFSGTVSDNARVDSTDILEFDYSGVLPKIGVQVGIRL